MEWPERPPKSWVGVNTFGLHEKQNFEPDRAEVRAAERYDSELTFSSSIS